MSKSDFKCPSCKTDKYVRWVADSSIVDIYVCDKCKSQFTVKK